MSTWRRVHPLGPALAVVVGLLGPQAAIAGMSSDTCLRPDLATHAVAELDLLSMAREGTAEWEEYRSGPDTAGHATVSAAVERLHNTCRVSFYVDATSPFSLHADWSRDALCPRAPPAFA